MAVISKIATNWAIDNIFRGGRTSRIVIILLDPEFQCVIKFWVLETSAEVQQTPMLKVSKIQFIKIFGN